MTQWTRQGHDSDEPEDMRQEGTFHSQNTMTCRWINIWFSFRSLFVWNIDATGADAESQTLIEKYVRVLFC